MGLGWIRRAFLFVIILIFVIILLHYWLLTKDYVFSEEAVATIAKKYAQEDPQKGINIKEAYKRIHVEMKSKYPRHILPEENLQWIFMNAGGWMGSICLLHASLTEYVLFFGTNVHTVGHSGRYWANISDTILTGTFRQWKEGSLDVNVFGPGDTVLHVWGEATAVDFKARLWMVEYGRGIIPSTLGFALADTLFSTQDFISMFRIFTVYGYALLQEAANVFTSLTDFFEDNAY